jgi:hypothetical protein
LKNEILHEVHGAVLGGHFGCKKTYHKLKMKYYWFEMKEDANNWVLKCDICEVNKRSARKAKAPLGNLTVGGVMECLATDILDPFPLTPRGNIFI